MIDELGDRMKMYEAASAGKFMPLLPIIARLDGRGFSSFTKGLKRPFDPIMSNIMVDVTKQLVKETNATMGYTQSDEITLSWHQTDVKSQLWFGGRISKMTSLLAAHATLHFYRLVCERLPEYADKLPTFDARVWQVPSRTEGANAFMWREWDATKNSITMAASHYYSHEFLMGKNGSEKQELLFQKGVNWNDYPNFFKRGTYVQRQTLEMALSAEDLELLPEKHHARLTPDAKFLRSSIEVVDMPVFGKVTNRNAVIFEGAKPVVLEDEA